MLAGPLSRAVIVNDCLDPAFRGWLDDRYPDFERIHHPEKRGFCGAVQTGWQVAAQSDYTFWLEDDFVFEEVVPLADMATTLNENRHLVQLALLRQPWSPEEKAVGGIMQMWPDEYEEKTDGESFWVEHKLFYTTNPGLFRGSLARENPWPDGPRCEEKFGQGLLAKDDSLRFAFWGKKFARNLVTHIGDERVGTGY